MQRIIMVAAISAALGLAAQGAQAGTASAGMNINATISSTCYITTSPVNFGEISQTAATTTTSTVGTTCTAGGVFTVAIDNGLNAVAGQRTLASGANTVKYDLYRDASHALRWGANSGVDTASGTGTGVTQNLTVYAQIPSGQTLSSGNGSAYTDTVQVTVTY